MGFQSKGGCCADIIFGYHIFKFFFIQLGFVFYFCGEFSQPGDPPPKKKRKWEVQQRAFWKRKNLNRHISRKKKL
jgi:hypothetical protein